MLVVDGGIFNIRIYGKPKIRFQNCKSFTMPNQIANKPKKCLNREHMGNHLVKVTQEILRFDGVVTSGEGFTVITKVLTKSYLPP